MSRVNKKDNFKESPLFWPAQLKGNTMHVLDETLVPSKMHYIKVTTVNQAVGVIKNMKTRAFGQFLVVLNTFLLVLNRKAKRSDAALVKELEQTATKLNGSRPTFPFSEVTSIIVGWGHAALSKNIPVKKYVIEHVQGYLMGIRHRRLGRVAQIAKVIKNGDVILTHCNVSGELAMAAAICKKEKKSVKFFATETRPYFQGAKLTCWELKKMGADVTLIADNAVAKVMSDGLVKKVIVGSDRSCANGDFANKIGTYQIAVLAAEFKIPFYALTQPSNKVKKGSDIPIEVRNDKELLSVKGKRFVGKNVKGFYPGFDVTPKKLVTEAIAINVN